MICLRSFFKGPENLRFLTANSVFFFNFYSRTLITKKSGFFQEFVLRPKKNNFCEGFKHFFQGPS